MASKRLSRFVQESVFIEAAWGGGERWDTVITWLLLILEYKDMKY